MTKVAIIGNAGGGKSTLCEALSKAKGLPIHQLDRLQWNPGWIYTPEDEFNRKHDLILNEEKWIIDGVATFESIVKRFSAADTIILVDYPLWVHYWWAAKRQFMCMVRPRPNFVEGCPMLPKTVELVKVMWRVNRHLLPLLRVIADQYASEKSIYHIRSPKELNRFIKEQCSI